MTDPTTTRTRTRPPGTRKAIHGFVSNDAHDGWHRFAVEHGVSVSALLEQFGAELSADLNGDDNGDTFAATLTRVITAGRRLDAANRRRNRRP